VNRPKPRARSRQTRPGRVPLLVAIVGGSGSGKSWLADGLEAALSPHVVRLSQDDFYRDRSHLPAVRRARLNFDHPRAIDWPKLEHCVRKLLSGQQALTPRYDFKTHSRRSDQQRLSPRPVILMDGLWLLRRRSLRSRVTLGVFIDCPTRTRLRRRLTRDLRQRGRSRDSVRRQFRATVEPMHARYVAPQARYADVVLSGAWGRSRIKLLADRLFQMAKLRRPRLRSNRPALMVPPAAANPQIAKRKPLSHKATFSHQGN
jgi:uridine kinase